MKYLLTLLFFVGIGFSQNLPVDQLARLIMKSAYFNKKNTDKYMVVYSPKTKKIANKIHKILGGKFEAYSSSFQVTEYSNVILVGLSENEIRALKSRSSNFLSIAYETGNIQYTSLSFGRKENGKPLILVNLSLAKDEADFKATFLKIASRAD
jgi:hypothetical protein